MVNKSKIITIAHGSGGKTSRDLVERIFFKTFDNEALNKAGDSAYLKMQNDNIAFTTDSFVVKPIFFPGGDIGKIAICGTVNDLAVAGAKPLYLSCGIIIEEGFLEDDLIRIAGSIAYWAKKAEVSVVTGDTKVVEKGEADGIFINTSGVGILKGKELSAGNIKTGDKIILTGTLGDHGIAVLSRRKGLEFDGSIESDCAPLNIMLNEVQDSVPGIKFMRDPTRGGLATTLNEIALDINMGIEINEEKIPVSETVQGACELLGMDPLYLANEGKAVIIVSNEYEDEVIRILKNHEYGKQAVTIGEIVDENPNKVCLRTKYGAKRIVEMLTHEQLPRIC